MTSNLFNQIGLGNLDIAYLFIGMAVLIIILLILCIVMINKTSKLTKRYNKFMEGKDCKNLEKELIGIFEDNRFLKAASEQNKKDIRKIYKNLDLTYQKVGLNKYDAFKEMGGKLSYSLALLNGNNDGFILNSVHSSDGCYSYTKTIKNGECSLELGTEEQIALDIALGNRKE